MKKTSFSQKQESIKTRIEEQLIQEGTEVKGLEDTINKISKGYMLVVQCLWYRIPNVKKVDALLKDYEEITKEALELLKKHDFEDLVYTYRKNYTNLFEVSKGEPREYHLSKNDYEEFIENVKSGDLSVLTKPTKAKKTTSKKKTKEEQKDLSMTSLILQVSKNGAKKMTKKEYNKFMANLKKTNDKAKEENSKKTTSKKKASKKKGWTEHDHSSHLDEKTFIKIKMNDNSNKFVRFLGMNDNATMNVNDHGTKTTIDIKDIKQVYTYSK